MADNKINLPGGFGGLTRYDEEYDSYINFSPTTILLLIVFLIGFRVALPLVYG